MAKRIISIILVLAVLMASGMSSAAEAQDEQAVKQVITGYFDLKYKILSALQYDKTISGYIFPDILASRDIMNEGDIIETVVKYRKAQINDLSFERYKHSLEYNSIKLDAGKAWVDLSESCEFYFKCAPTVKNTSKTDHMMLLRKKEGKWYISADDYADPDGIKNKLNKYFIGENLSKKASIDKVLKESELQASGRLDELQELMKEIKEKNMMVFHAGKTVSYADGKAERIDKEKDVTPVLLSNTVMLPLLYGLEKAGCKASWPDKETIKISAPGKREIKINAGSTSMYVNNKKVALKIPAKVINGTVMLPAETFADVTGKKMFYDGKGLLILTDNTFDNKKNSRLVGKLQEFFGVLFTKAEFPRIDGSTATYPFSMEMGKELLGLDDTAVKGFITHNTTHNAYVSLINKNADIIFVTQPSQDEYSLAKEKGIELEVVPICREGFVFIANKGNAVNNLSAGQVQDIYQGKIKNWKEVGGEDIEIIPYQREENSGSQTLMENTVMKGLKLIPPPKEVLVYGMGELIDRVADYSNAKNALGYSVYYYATSMYANRNVKLISINGVLPDKRTIKNGTYPFTVSYYAVLRKNEPQESNARKLLKWILGEEGQGVVDRAGFVPVK